MHIRREDGSVLCGAKEGDSITFEEALTFFTGTEKAFDCVNCHKVLTGNQKHSRPKGEE